MKRILIIFIISILTIDFTNACTTFVINDSTDLVYGRNYDFNFGSGIIVINKSGIEKQAFVQPPNKPARWISKYGSITFNQAGVDAPMDGMNEKGLVIALMGLSEIKYPSVDANETVNELEWIQYQLDNSATLEDVLENNKKIRIACFSSLPVHYLICDSLGNIGVVEYLNGELVVYKGDNIFIPVCSNMTYGQSKNALMEYDGFGGQKIIPEKFIPGEWYNIPEVIAIAGSRINKYKKLKDKNPVNYSFSILNAVGVPTLTQWSVVYDIKNKKINFKTLSNKNIRTINFKNFVFSCNNEIQILDIQGSNVESDVKLQFLKLTSDYYSNYKKKLVGLYKANFKGFPDIPDEILKLEVEYVMNRKCKY